ncbi:MAG: hypothetical protein ACFFE2_02465 [Candidatus Thorarchaeota archaeon]
MRRKISPLAECAARLYVMLVGFLPMEFALIVRRLDVRFVVSTWHLGRATVAESLFVRIME